MMESPAQNRLGDRDSRETTGSEADVTVITPSISVHTFTGQVMQHQIFFQVTKLCDSFHLWVGKSGSFGDLAVAMTMMGSRPSSTVLIGGCDSPTVAMAQRLSKRTGKQVFVSGDLHFDQLNIPLIEKRISEEIQNQPDKFT